jgi:hypothetical protein
LRGNDEATTIVDIFTDGSPGRKARRRIWVVHTRAVRLGPLTFPGSFRVAHPKSRALSPFPSATSNLSLDRCSTYMVIFHMNYAPKPRRPSALASTQPCLFASRSFALPRKTHISKPFICHGLRTLHSLLNTRVNDNSFRIRWIRTLFENTGGVWGLFPFWNSYLAIRARRSGSFSRVTGPPRASRDHLPRVTYTFRINTCKSVSKQTTLTPFRMNTYEKQGGGGRGTAQFLACRGRPGQLC